MSDNQWIGTAIDPQPLVATYLAQHDAPAVVSNLPLVQGLIALSPADRLAWGVYAASLFPVPSDPSANTYSVDSITGITGAAFQMLTELCGGFAQFVGSWNFDGVSAAKPATEPSALQPNTPQVASVTVTTTDGAGNFFDHVGKDIEEALAKAEAWIKAKL